MSEISTVLDQLKAVDGELKHLRTDIGTAKENREAIDAVKHETAELATRYQKDIEQREAETEAFHQKLDAIENSLKRFYKSGENGSPEHEQHKRAFNQFLRRGAGSDVDEMRGSDYYINLEKRALSTGTDTEGGFLVDPETESQIIKNVVQISRMRQLAAVSSIGSDTLEIPKRTSNSTAYWVNESEEPTASSPAYGKIRIPTHPVAVNIPASLNFLQDVANSEAEITSDAAEQIAYAEGDAFVNGTGVNQPEGFLTNSDVSVAVDTGTGAVTGDAFIQLKTEFLKEEYWDTARYVFNQATLSGILELKDGQNNYLWNLQVGFSAGAPLLINGTPWTIISGMPAEGANTKPVAVGAWNRGYRIVDRLGTYVLRDPYTAKPDIEFMFRKRVGGQVVLPEAIKIMQV